MFKYFSFAQMQLISEPSGKTGAGLYFQMHNINTAILDSRSVFACPYTCRCMVTRHCAAKYLCIVVSHQS